MVRKIFYSNINECNSLVAKVEENKTTRVNTGSLLGDDMLVTDGETVLCVCSSILIVSGVTGRGERSLTCTSVTSLVERDGRKKSFFI